MLLDGLMYNQGMCGYWLACAQWFSWPGWLLTCNLAHPPTSKKKMASLIFSLFLCHYSKIYEMEEELMVCGNNFKTIQIQLDQVSHGLGEVLQFEL